MGTVDNFQRQEAPIVVHSMATPIAGQAREAMEFHYGLHRLNVATSRARCVAAIVANPVLGTPERATSGRRAPVGIKSEAIGRARAAPAASGN